jgi:hypothetical protein
VGATPPTKPSERFGTVIGVVFLAVMAAFMLIGGGLRLAGALGLAGSPARLTVSQCHTVGSGRGSHTVCGGVLRSPGGHVIDPHVTISADPDPGTTIPVRWRVPTVGLETVGPPAVVGWSALFLGGVCLTGCGLFALVHGERWKVPMMLVGVVTLLSLGLALLGIPVYVVTLLLH